MEPCTLLLLAVASSVMALVGIKRLAPAEERDGKRRRADRSEPAGFFGERLVQAMQGRVNGTRLEKLKALLARGPVLVAASVVRKALVTLRQQLVKIQKDTPSLKDRPVPEEHAVIGKQLFSKAKGKVNMLASVMMHFPLSKFSMFGERGQSHKFEGKQQGGFQFGAVEGIWEGAKDAYLCFTGLIYAKLLQLLPFLHNLVVMDAHPFAGNANAGGININDPVHIQVVKLNANTLYNLGCRIFWVPSAAAVKGLLKAFESRCKDARKDHFDVKVPLFLGATVRVHVLFLDGDEVVIVFGVPHLSLMRMPFLAWGMLRSLFAFGSLLGAAVTPDLYKQARVLIINGAASEEDEETAFNEWVRKRLKSKTEKQKARKMYLERCPVPEIYSSIYGARDWSDEQAELHGGLSKWQYAGNTRALLHDGRWYPLGSHVRDDGQVLLASGVVVSADVAQSLHQSTAGRTGANAMVSDGKGAQVKHTSNISTTHGATRLSAAKAVIARHLPSHSYTRKNESRNGCSQLFCSSVTGNNNGGGERVRCTHCRGSFFFNVQARGVVYADVRNTFYGADAEKAEAAANAHLAHLLQPFGGSVEKEKQHWEQHP